MIIRKETTPFTQFFFRTDKKEFRERNDFCESCHGFMDPCYAEIINKLRKTNILHPDHRSLCCFCSYIEDMIGFTRCPKCNNLLSVNDIKERPSCRVIYCYNCCIIYKEFTIKLGGRLDENHESI